MSIEGPKMLSSEEIKKIKEDRIKSNKEFIIGGADLSDDNQIIATDEQIEKAKGEMEENLLIEKMKNLTDKDKSFINAIANHDELMYLIDGRIEDVKLKNDLRDALQNIFNNLHDLYRFKPGDLHEDKNSVDLEDIGHKVQEEKANTFIREGVWSEDRYGEK